MKPARFISNEADSHAATYSDDWIKLPVWKFHSLYLPNFPARRKATLHDIDHILTEYNTDWRGEWQISAFEIGTGCGKYWAGWFINLQGIIVGGICYPLDSVRAYARGRRSRGVYNYRDHEPLLSEKVGKLRSQLAVSAASVTVTAIDAILFYFTVLFSIAINFGPLARRKGPLLSFREITAAGPKEPPGSRRSRRNSCWPQNPTRNRRSARFPNEA